MYLRTCFSLAVLLALASCSAPVRNTTEAVQDPVLRPWGIIGAKITDTMEGVLVTDIIHGSTAEAAGLRLDDRILSVDGKAAASTGQLMDDIRSRLPGTIMQIGIARNSRKTTLRVTVGEFPLDEQLWLMASSALKAWDSLRARQLSGEFLRRFPPTNRYAARMARLRADLAHQDGSGERKP